MQAVRVRFATNRNRVKGDALFGDMFQNGNPKTYVTGSIEVVRLSSKPDNGWWPVPSTLIVDPPTTALVRPLVGRSGTMTSATGILEFARSRKEEHDRAKRAVGYGLVLLPGFASTFDDAMRRAAQVCTGYKAEDIFCFSWPANGRVNLDDYRKDRDDALASGDAIADALAQLFAFMVALPEKRRPTLNLVAHSMGTFALRHAIQAIKARYPDLVKNRVFAGALLMAADEDDDALSDASRLRPLLTLARRTAAYSCWR